jgi:hypothetical protein
MSSEQLAPETEVVNGLVVLYVRPWVSAASYSHDDDPATQAVATNGIVSTAEPDTLKPVTEMLVSVEFTFPPADELPTDRMSHPAGADSVKDPSVLEDGVIEKEKDPFVPPGFTPTTVVRVAFALGAAADADGASRIAATAITMRTTVTRVARTLLRFIFRSF